MHAHVNGRFDVLQAPEGKLSERMRSLQRKQGLMFNEKGKLWRRRFTACRLRPPRVDLICVCVCVCLQSQCFTKRAITCAIMHKGIIFVWFFHFVYA